MKKFLIKNWRGVAIILGAALLILWNVHLINQNWINQKKAEIAEYNEKVAKDSLKVEKDRQGRVEYNRLAYLTDKVDNLTKLSSELANEVKNVKGKVSTIIQGEVKIVEKPVPFLVRGEFIDSTVTAYFNYDSIYSPGNYRKLSGYTKYDLRSGLTSGLKQTDEFGLKVTTGIKNLDKGKPEIFFKSDYPGFQVTSLEGAVLDPKLFEPKKKTPLITPSLTIGWTPAIWNNKDQKVQVNPGNFGVTAGVGFNIFRILGIKK